jgi:hypothetical protein
VDTQDVRHVRVRFGELDQELEQLAKRSSRAALGSGNAQPPEARIGELPDLFVGRDAFGLALGSAHRDLGEQRLQAGGARPEHASTTGAIARFAARCAKGNRARS